MHSCQRQTAIDPATKMRIVPSANTPQLQIKITGKRSQTCISTGIKDQTDSTQIKTKLYYGQALPYPVSTYTQQISIGKTVKLNLLQIAYEFFSQYTVWLKAQDLTEHEVRAQLCRVNHFLVFLGTAFSGEENIFTNSYRRDGALREYKNYLRHKIKSPAQSIEATLESTDRFFQFIGLPPTKVQADPPVPLKALSEHELTRFLTTLRSRINAREKALICLMLYAGLVPQECALIDLPDVKLSTTTGFAIFGRDNVRYKLMLDTECRLAIREYLQERASQYPFMDRPALFLDERGNRLTAAAVDAIVRQIGHEAGIEVTARSLQQTFQYQEALKQNKALLAAELLSGVVQVS